MTTGWVLINTELGSEADALKDLKKVAEVQEVYAVYGVYDIVAKVKAGTMRARLQLRTQPLLSDACATPSSPSFRACIAELHSSNH